MQTKHDISIGNLTLINLRSFDVAEQAQWLQHESRHHILLSANRAISRQLWQELSPWEKSRARAIATGHSAYRAVVVGRSAARIWRLPLLGATEPVELCSYGTTSAPSRSQWPRDVIYRNWHLPPDDVQVWHGLRVTNRLRTTFDVIRTSDLAQGLMLLDAELQQGGNRKKLERTFRAFGRAHGVKRIWRTLAHASGLAESPLESKARAQLLEAGLPEITEIRLQAEIAVEGITYRVDILINGWLALELDGAIKYAEDAAHAIRRERAREKRIQNTGLRVLRFSNADLEEPSGRPSRFLTEVAAVLRQPGQLAA